MATSSAFVIGVASNLLMLPLYLRAWSTVVYGEWMALWALVFYLQNCDFGLTAATLNAATMSYARGDRTEFSRVRDTAWAISITISSTVFFCAVLAALFLPIREWLRFQVLSAKDVRYMAILLAGNYLLSLPIGQLRNAFAASGRFHIYQWLYNIGALQAMIITAVQLLAKHPPLWVAIGGFVSQVLSMVTVLVALRFSDRALLPKLRGADSTAVAALLKPSAFFGVTILSSAIQLQVPVLLISRNLGGTAVALFTSARTICNMLKQIPMMVQLPLNRELSSLAGQGRSAELRHLHRAFMAVTLVISASILAIIYVRGPWIVALWSHGHLQIDSTMFRILAFSVFLDANTAAWAATAVARNENSGVAKIQLLSALVMSAIAVLTLPRLQLIAAPIALLVTVLIVNVPLLYREVVRRNELSWLWSAKNMILPSAVALAIVVVVCSWLIWLNGMSNWMLTIVAAACCLLATSIFMLAVLLDRVERRTIWDMFKKALPA